MFSFLQIALIMGLQTLQAHEVCPSRGLGHQGPAGGRRLGSAPARSSALGTARRAAGPRREVAAKKAKAAAVGAVTLALGTPGAGPRGRGAQDAEPPGAPNFRLL